MRPTILPVLLLLAAVPAGRAVAAPPAVVVTTSMIATAVHDVAGDALSVETLMPAGTCPGEFDLEPRQARLVRAAVLVIRHDYQGALTARFTAAGAPADAVVAPSAASPLTIPANYAAFCDAIARELARRLPGLAGRMQTRLTAIRQRTAAEATSLRAGAASLRGTRVVAAAFQADFLRWLGLDVVAVFPPDDDPPPRTLLDVIGAGRSHHATLVVGNRQNGRRVPATIARALGVPVAILSNFPARGTAGAYEELLDANLRALQAAKARPAAPAAASSAP